MPAQHDLASVMSVDEVNALLDSAYPQLNRDYRGYEATAVFAGAGGASWAVAIRLERRRGTWLCLVLDVL